MEKLANLNQTDINNGVLFRMLASAGIPDVPEYVKKFHQETEELIIEEFEHPDQHNVDNDEHIIPPADIQSWISSFRPHFDDSIQPPLCEVQQPEQQQQQLPADVQGRITSLKPRSDDPVQPPLREVQQPKQQQQHMPADVQSWIISLKPRFDDPVPSPVSEQQEPQQQPPTDLKSWLQHMAPNNLQLAADTASSQTITASDDEAVVSGNLGIWLYDWSKSLMEQPPPTSLDEWLQSLIPKDVCEPIGKKRTAKVRLNSYLNAAQEVLSKHGYDVDNEVKPPTNVQTKTGKFGNVKQMYFLWKKLDKNNDRKITVEDVQIILQEMGLGFLSKHVAQTLFEIVDSDHDGALQFRDFIALMGIIKQLVAAVGSANTKA